MRRWQAMLVIAAVGCGRPEAGFEALRAVPGVFGVPNLDDDDDNNQRDFPQAGVDGENDRAVLAIDGVAEGLRGRDTLVLTLSGQRSNLRVWDGDRVLLDADQSTVEVAADAVPAMLEVEFGDYLVEGVLQIEQRTRKGDVVQEAQIRLLSAPLILNHHLQAVETSYAVEGSETEFEYYGYSYSFDNLAMIDAMHESLPDAFVAPSIEQYQFDPWVQDEFETATLTSPDARIDVVIDSIRDRGLDPFPERVVVGDDSLVRTWGRQAKPSSQDSFGNLEVSPPVTVDGVHYPFGRVYYGNWTPGGTPVDALRSMLEDQRVQAPFELDVTFLCVGHVDEFVTFLPDPSAPKGFRMYVADTALGYSFLEGLDQAAELPRYAADHEYASVGELVSDSALRAFNEDVQRDGIDPNVAVFVRELGLVEDDIVRVPGLFEEVGCGGPRAVSLIPGTVNMLVVTDDAGGAQLFLPDPFLRADEAQQSSDPLIQYVNDLLPASATPVWVDDWELYHLGWGEVHCGTNAVRSPAAEWWTDALHLIDGGVSR